RLAQMRHPQIAEHSREETRVDEVQDRVLDATAVKVDWSPVPDFFRIEGQLIVLRIAEAEEVPRGVDECVHRVRLTTRGSAALGTPGVHAFRDLRKRRVAAAGEVRRLRQ